MGILLMWGVITMLLPAMAGFVLARGHASRLLLGMLLVAGLVWALTVFAPYVFVPQAARPGGPDNHFGPGFAREINQYIAGAVFLSLSVGGLVGWMFSGSRHDG